MIAGILSIIFWIGLVPLCVGALITTCFQVKVNIFYKSYLFGLIVCFAWFQVLAVTNMFTVNNFVLVCTYFSYSTVILGAIGVLLFVLSRVRRKNVPVVNGQEIKADEDKKRKIESLVLWLLFGGIVLFQLVQTLRLTYPDGDDAYYVGVATYGAYVSEMYSKVPYTGAYSGFDSRHCLAPFPYFISFLSRMSNISAVTIAHSVLPVCFILFAYGIYYLIAKELCREKREVSLFMLLISVLFMFGNYSVYSMETFLMTRTRQGKASLGSFALPLAFYLLLLLAKKMDGPKKERVLCYILLGCNGFVAALFTTMGNFIYPCVVMLGSVCICFGKKDWKKLFPLALTCVPSALMAVLYLMIR